MAAGMTVPDDGSHASGRDQPLVPDGNDVLHVLRFWGADDGLGSIRVTCDTCPGGWARTFEGGKTEEKLLGILPWMHYGNLEGDEGSGNGDPAEAEVQEAGNVEEDQGKGKRKFRLKWRV